MGLVQREIEVAGFSTITLASIPDLMASVSVPRIAAIERPLGAPFGVPGDGEGQIAVLRATFRALEHIGTPGGMVHLPFEWDESAGKVSSHPPESPPIAKHIVRHPWHLRRLLTRQVPPDAVDGRSEAGTLEDTPDPERYRVRRPAVG